jgi:hypothetical protein
MEHKEESPHSMHCIRHSCFKMDLCQLLEAASVATKHEAIDSF